jgi:integrase
MFNIARKQWKWKMDNPVSEIELPKVRNERVRYLSKDEYSRLFDAHEAVDNLWIKPLVVVALGTGLRLSNLCNLLWREIDMVNRTITIEAEKMKNDEYLGIPFPESVYMELQVLQRVKNLSGHVFHDKGETLYAVKVQRAFRKVLKAARISNFRFHDLRHCYCSSLRQRNVDLHTIAKLAGHQDLRMTKRYAHLNVENLREAVSKLETTTILRQQVGR